MRICTLNDFMTELRPWLDKDHIRGAELNEENHLVLYFMDGMKHVYQIADCDLYEVREVLDHLRHQGIPVRE